jgi:oligosaccharyltransferase complex subunit alpha (ribophorin I)
MPIFSSHTEVHKTFMDTIGRPMIVLKAKNAIEEWRSRGDIIVTYEYPWTAGLRKPLTIAAAMFGVYFTVWVVGNLDVRIGKK